MLQFENVNKKTNLWNGIFIKTDKRRNKNLNLARDHERN